MSTAPKILTLDIETAPATAYVWGLFDQNIGLNQLIRPGRTIMVGAKWLGDRKVHQWDETGGAKEMFAGVHALLSEADAVVTYNGDRFDLPRLAGAFVEHGLGPLPPLTSIDLLRTVKRLGAQSNKLEYIAKHLNIGAKIDAGGFSLWTGCMDGDARAWAKMRKYNVMDVRLTERLHTTLRPHIKNHPYLGQRAAGGEFECPHCLTVGGRHQFRGTRRTRASIIPRIQCLECGGWSAGKRVAVTSAKRS